MKPILILFTALWASQLAAQGSQTPNVWLVAVGIGAYQHDDILTRLDFTIQGAYEFTRIFEGRQLMGFKAPVLTNQKARRTDIVRALENTFVNNPEVQPDDLILFYFSGHGEIAGGKAGICPYDYAGEVRGLVTDEEIQAIMKRSPARHKVCFIEACKTEAQSAAIFDPNILDSFNKQRKGIAGGLVYMTSTRMGEKSWGKPDIGGYFTHFLLRGLEGEANANDDAYITVSELFGFVEKGVKSFSLDKQVPQINDRAGYDSAMPLMVIPDKLPKPAPVPTTPVETHRSVAQPTHAPTGYPPGFEYLATDMVYVPGGEFEMGDNFNDEGAGADEKPVHRVKLDPYYLCRYEVTQAQWEAVMGSNPSFFKDCPTCPVENVSWDDVQLYIKKLNEKTGKRFRLPTEAEWEYAAREGGKTVRFGNGKDVANPAEMNFDGRDAYKKPYSVAGEYRRKTVPVNSFAPNALGLYNMSGNVWEWCSDWYGSDYYTKIKNTTTHNPTGPTTGSYRVCRGGSWDYVTEYCRAANRDGNSSVNRLIALGFRVAQDQ